MWFYFFFDNKEVLGTFILKVLLSWTNGALLGSCTNTTEKPDRLKFDDKYFNVATQ